jgi:acyl carrier protein
LVPGISAAQVLLKRGRARNELTRYRYDVVLQVGQQVEVESPGDAVHWGIGIGSVANLETLLRQRHWDAVRLVSIPDARLASELAAQQLADNGDERLEAGAIRPQVATLSFDACDPDTLIELCERHGYAATAHPTAEIGRFELQLSHRERAGGPLRWRAPDVAVTNWRTYANDPLENGLEQQLVPRLREYLKTHLPDFMLPSAWVVLKQLPLMPSGKVDRRALPDPQGRPEDMGEYAAPRTEVQRGLAEIWAQLLQVDRVGLRDNFFELGGHSLHGMKLIAEIAQRFAVQLSAVVVFKHPTVESMAAAIEEVCSVQPTSHGPDAELEDGVI